MTEDKYDIEGYQQTSGVYREAQDDLRTKIGAVGDAFHVVAGTIHGSGTPGETGIKLKTAGYAIIELGQAFITWNAALEAHMAQTEGHG